MNCPSAPMFHTLARKAIARPSAIIASGVALMASSLSARPSRSGSTKNIASARAGGLPSAANSTAPVATVIASAASGDSSAAARDDRKPGAPGDEDGGDTAGVAMTGGASLAMRARLSAGGGKIAAHPLADLRDARLAHRDARRQAPARHHYKIGRDLEQLVQVL